MIERADVLELHDTLGKKHKVAANRTAQLIRLLFNFAISAELWKGVNPAERIKRFPEHPRRRFLNHEELPRLFMALSDEPLADLRDFVVLALFTGCRKSDIFSARWENISFEDRRWMIPDPKREAYAVPITIECEEILKERQKRAGNTPWVFPSNDSNSGHVEDLKDRWKLLLERAKIENLTMHDLRRTHASWSVARGNSLFIVSKGLGQASIASAKPYAQLDLDPVRIAMTATNAALLEAMKRKPQQLLDT